MINKIQKVALVTLKNHIIINQNAAQQLTNPEDQIRSIHSYFVMLRHIFQKNKQVIRKRNQSLSQNKSEHGGLQPKSQKGEEDKNKIEQASFGILKNPNNDNCNLVMKGVNHHYRPYRGRHRSLNVTAKGLSTSVPNIPKEKQEAFKPIGQKYHQCKVMSGQKPRSLSKSRAQFGTCINFYPRYQKNAAAIAKTTVEFNKNQLKKERRTLLGRSKQTHTEPTQADSLRSSHKSAFSNKSQATESSEVPSPW